MADESELNRLRRELASTQGQLTAGRAALQRELEVAARVHSSLLPKPQRHEAILVDSRYVPIEQVGGDYCQVRFPEPDTCYITMCDVTGHGLGAALLATRVSSEVRHCILDRLPPREIVRSLNAFIVEHFGETALYLTFVAARIDLSCRRITWSGAGHPSPLLIRNAGANVHELRSQHPLIGVFEQIVGEAPEHALELEPGDRLFFYTDGIIETANAGGRQLGTTGLSRIGVESMGLDLFDVAGHVLDRVDGHRHGPSNDDKTLIVAQLR